MSTEQSKPVPPLDLSMKYMAWDQKRIANAEEEKVNQLKVQNDYLREISGSLKEISSFLRRGQPQTMQRSAPNMVEDLPF